MLLFLLYHTLVCMYMDDLQERGYKLDCAFLEIPCRYDCSTGILIVGGNDKCLFYLLFGTKLHNIRPT